MSKKRSYGLQQIDQKISSLLKPIFQGSKKEFILINNLVKNWEELIGKKYAKFCYPKTVSFSKGKGSLTKLTIAVYNPAIGHFLENNSEVIIERIATFYGFKSISKIIIKQEPKDIELKKNQEIKLPKEQEKFLQDKISEVEDEELAKTLQKLGRMVFKDSNS